MMHLAEPIVAQRAHSDYFNSVLIQAAFRLNVFKLNQFDLALNSKQRNKVRSIITKFSTIFLLGPIVLYQDDSCTSRILNSHLVKMIDAS